MIELYAQEPIFRRKIEQNNHIQAVVMHMCDSEKKSKHTQRNTQVWVKIPFNHFRTQN